MQGRPVHEVNSSTGDLDDFLLSQAMSNVNENFSRTVVGASFDTVALTQSLPSFNLSQLPIDGNLPRVGLPGMTHWPSLDGLPAVGGLPDIGGWPSANMSTSPVDISQLVLGLLSLNGTRQSPLIVGHFSVESYHAIAVCLALVDLAKLSFIAPGSGYHIQTINHPLPRQPETVVMDKVSNTHAIQNHMSTYGAAVRLTFNILS